MRWCNLKSLTRVGAAALLILFAQALSACGDADKADVPRGETEEEAGLKREILDVERRLDGLQSKVKEVMEGLKGEDTEEKPSADVAAEKAETPSEELQRVMESLETPIGAEAPEEHAAKQGEETRQGEENPEAPVAKSQPEIKPAHPGEEVKSGTGKPEAPVVAASPKILPPLPEERPAQAARKTEPAAEAGTPKARPSQPVEETKKDTQEKAAAEVAKTPAPAPEPAPAVKIIDDLNHFDLGLIEWRQNNLPAAIVHFKAAIASEPANAHAYWNLALVYDQQGEGTKAIRMMEEAEKIYKNFGDQEDMLKARDHLLSWHEKYGDGPGMANRGKS